MLSISFVALATFMASGGCTLENLLQRPQRTPTANLVPNSTRARFQAVGETFYRVNYGLCNLFSFKIVVITVLQLQENDKDHYCF